jgi:hypothetical protein
MIQFIIRSIAASAVIAGGKKLYDFAAGELTADTVIEFSSGTARVTKGGMSSRALGAVAQVLVENGIQSGKIEIRKNGKFAFSRQIPETIHQRLRNIVMNA